MTIVEKLRKGVTTRSARQTRALAAELAAVLPPVATLALHGDMGVGKTTFVQGLARGLGVPERVTSPGELRKMLVRLADEARAKAFPTIRSTPP